MAWLPTRVAHKIGLSPGTLVYIGEKPSTSSRVTLAQYQGDQCEVETFKSWGAAKEKLKDGWSKWIHVEGLHDVQLVDDVGAAFGIHQMSLEDLLNSQHRPKMSEMEDHLLFIYKNLMADPKSLISMDEHAGLVLGQDFVLSFAEKPSDYLKPIYERLQMPEGRLRQLGSPYLAFAILDLTLDHYTAVLDRLESAVDQMETQILRRSSDLILSQVYQVKAEMAYLSKISVPFRNFLHQTAEGTWSWMNEEMEIYFRDLDDHGTQIVDTCESIRETLRNILDVSDSASAHNMNVMLRFFTAVSAIFLPLNFMASVYGMNFQEMPGLTHSLGFFVMIGVMATIAIMVALFFRFKRWW